MEQSTTAADHAHPKQSKNSPVEETIKAGKMASTKQVAASSLSVGDVKLEEKPPLEGNISFSNVPLDEEKGKKKKIPRRILHFSDGILEEYSTEEEDEDQTPKPHPVDPKTLQWAPWFWYYVVTVSCKSLSAIDYMGEKLAWFFGITSPKYQSAIDEFHRQKDEERREAEEQEREEQAERRREEEMSQIEGAYESVYRDSGSQSESISTAEVKPMVTSETEESIKF